MCVPKGVFICGLHPPPPPHAGMGTATRSAHAPFKEQVWGSSVGEGKERMRVG